MGKVLSIMVRQSRRVFVQERAERIISKPKPKMHPFYPTEEKVIKQIKAEHPELAEKVKEWQPQLDERVGSIRITSADVPRRIEAQEQQKLAIESGSTKDTRLLPQERVSPDESDSGFYEPAADKVPRGRLLFSEAMMILQMRENEKQQGLELAKQRGINENDVKSLLEYFAPFARSVDLTDKPKKQFEYDEEREKMAIGRRKFLQQERLVSELEKRRITARLEAKTDANSSEQKIDSESSDDRKR